MNTLKFLFHTQSSADIRKKDQQKIMEYLDITHMYIYVYVPIQFFMYFVSHS